MHQPRAIYVESRIGSSIDDVWAHTQQPAVHQRWDVRFTQIDYLPRSNINEPQQFVYATKVAPGLRVSGRGETLGEQHRPDGTAYSGLRFWSDHPLSLIEQGSGYWRYVPVDGDSVRFLTRYDYTVRWGAFGRLIDRVVFRRLFGWGTAWSFDRLRLWIECGITPEQSLRRSIARGLALIMLGALAAAMTMKTVFAVLGSGDGVWNLALIAALTWSATIAALLTRHNLPSGRVPLRTRPSSDRPVADDHSLAIDQPLSSNPLSSKPQRNAVQ